MDIRLLTRCVVQKGNLYFRCKDDVYGLMWSDSPYEAWSTRKLDTAYRVAWKLGGSVRLFNPVVNEVAPLRGKSVFTANAQGSQKQLTRTV
jgi:hypothetical protein